MLGDRLCCLLWGTVCRLNVVETAKVAFLDSVQVVQIVFYLYDYQVMEWLPRNSCCGALRVVGFFVVPLNYQSPGCHTLSQR